MKVTRKTHQAVRIQNILFGILFCAVMGLLAWLSTQYTAQSDWTKNQRNSLSAPSIQLLQQVSSPISITAFVTENTIVRQQITELINKYQHHKKNISLSFVNPDTRPDLAREEGITTDGELIIQLNNKRESLRVLDEQSLTNALQRLTVSQQRWVVFLSGHGERSADNDANFDVSLFSNELKRKGINYQNLNLIETPSIPQNTSLLIIADPKSAFLAGEMDIIRQYINSGKPVLWLVEPGSSNQQTMLDELFGINVLKGVVVDATTQLFGINDPTYALVTEYTSHAVTQHLQALSLFPGAAGLTVQQPSNFKATALLSTLERSWTETGNISGDIQFDSQSDETQGPITIGYSLTREINPNNNDTAINQRIAIIGDADFLSNAFLGNGANLDLGLSLVQWLNTDDNLINIPAKTSADSALNINQTWTLVFGLGFLIILPLLFIVTGVVIWLKRKKR